MADLRPRPARGTVVNSPPLTLYDNSKERTPKSSETSNSAGTSSILVEIAEDNVAKGEGQTSLSTLPFVKDGLYRSEIALADGKVINGALDYTTGNAAAAIMSGMCSTGS